MARQTLRCEFRNKLSQPTTRTPRALMTHEKMRLSETNTQPFFSAVSPMSASILLLFLEWRRSSSFRISL